MAVRKNTSVAIVVGLALSGGVAGDGGVLLLGDNGSQSQVQAALEAEGIPVFFAGHHYDWDGVTPDALEFDVVVFLDGYDYGYGLQPAADTAVVNFVAGGGGLVITEYAAYDVFHGSMSPGIASLMPVTSPAGSYTYGGTWNVIVPSHPLAAGVPATWHDDSVYSLVTAGTGATVVAETDAGVPLLTESTASGGPVVHVNHDLTYETDIIHPFALKLIVNAAIHAGGLDDVDCNGNGTPDYQDFAVGADVDFNRIPDACEDDCNGNGVPDWLDVEMQTLFRTAFAFESGTVLDWQEGDDDSGTYYESDYAIAMPFAVTIAGETYVAFNQNSNGYVELLRAGDHPYDPGYGTVESLTTYGGAGLTHTYLMAAFDDLTSGYYGRFGFLVEADHVIFFWDTETYDDGDTGLLNRFEIVLHADGRVDWHFADANFSSYGNDLYSGLYLGHAGETLIEVSSGTIPSYESWTWDEATGTPQSIPFEFHVEQPMLDWQDADDTAQSPQTALPFALTLGDETYDSFVQTSDGCIELLRAGETAYGFTYGYVDDLINYDGGTGGPTHTYVMMMFDDLSSYDDGCYFGYRLEGDRVLFYWNTETYDDDDDNRVNGIEVILASDGSVTWNFGGTNYAYYGYDLFTGVYLGHDEQTLYEAARGYVPLHQSWRFDLAGVAGGTSMDCNLDGIPDECDSVIPGDLNGDGVVDIDDLLVVLGAFGPCDPCDCPGDTDFDNDVDIDDLLAVLANWTQ